GQLMRLSYSQQALVIKGSVNEIVIFSTGIGQWVRRPGIGLGGAATTPDGLACPCGDVPRSAPAASSSANATPRPARLSSAPPSAALAGRPRSSPSVSTPPPPAAQPAPPPPHPRSAQ